MAALPRLRAAIVNVLLPILLAWIVIATVHRWVYPPAIRAKAVRLAGYGPIQMTLDLPGTAPEIPEPLLVCGRPGDATLIYIRVFKHAEARVGVEFWGVGAYESPKFKLASAFARIELVCSVPALFPAAGDPRWRSMPTSETNRLTRGYHITVDGVARLDGTVNYTVPPHSPLYIGLNPIGGSLVSSAFTGTVVNWSEPNPWNAQDGRPTR